MSTTDTRAAFEAWMREEYGADDDMLKRPYEDRYFWPRAADAWAGWQAAAEAAKATGTAWDLPELPQCFGSIDVYHDSGQVTSVDGWTADQMRGYAIDYAMQLGLAARQPAPVAIKTWQERMKTTKLTWKTGDGKLIAEYQLMTEEIADLRAALAATAAPALSDEHIKEAAMQAWPNLPENWWERKGEVWNGAKVFALAILAATNRSQP